MLHLSLITLALFSGVLVGPFPLAQAEPDHHQVMVRAAMAPDGSFAVAWVDSLRIIEGNPPYQISETDIYVRFFNPQGEPLSDAYKIPKAVDTNWVFEPCLDMDSAGNTILVWQEAPIRLSTYRDIRYQRFNFGAVPASQPKTLKDEMWLSWASYKPIHADLNQQGEIALAWSQIVWDSFFRQQVWIQRFSYQGEPLDSAFMAHKEKSERYDYVYPRVALNDDGYVVVTWLDFIVTLHMFPMFQIFDPDDQPLYPEDTLGLRIDENPDTVYGASRPEPHWLDNERFVLFWPNYYMPLFPKGAFLGRVFSDRGLTSHPERILVHQDSLGTAASSDVMGIYTSDVCGDSFIYSSRRTYYDMPGPDPEQWLFWNHYGGIIGEVENNIPIRQTNFFEYTPSWDPDTVDCRIDFVRYHIPAVACNKDRIVWVYPRLNQDTIFEAYLLITDWDMGVGVTEQLIPGTSPIKLETTLNRLSYDLLGQAELTLYSADGRRILEETIEGKGTWVAPIGFPSGVYFARVEGGTHSANAKLVVLK